MYDKLLKPWQSFWITLYIYIHIYMYILQTVQSKFHKTECPLHQALTTAVSHHTKAGTSCDSCQGHDKRDKLHPQIFWNGSAVQNGKQEWGKENAHVFMNQYGHAWESVMQSEGKFLYCWPRFLPSTVRHLSPRPSRDEIWYSKSLHDNIKL